MVIFQVKLVSWFPSVSSSTHSRKEPLGTSDKVLYGLDGLPVTQPAVSNH